VETSKRLCGRRPIARLARPCSTEELCCRANESTVAEVTHRRRGCTRCLTARLFGRRVAGPTRSSDRRAILQLGRATAALSVGVLMRRTSRGLVSDQTGIEKTIRAPDLHETDYTPWEGHV